MKTPKIAVLIPCFNEGLTIGKVVGDFRVELPEAKIFVFDNNSTDDTAAKAAAAGAVVMKEPRQGKGNVIEQMFRTVDADVYVLVDGDDTYPANHVKNLIRPVVDGSADMVVGDRLSGSYFTENKRLFHNSGNRVVRWLINIIFRTDLKDILSGFRVFNRDFVSNFPIMSRGFEIETEMTIHALDKGYIINEVPVPYRDRPQGSASKLNTFADGKKVIKTIFRLFRDYKPFAFFSFLALLTMLFGIILLVPVFAEYYRTGLVPRFPTLIVGCFVELTALLLFFVGLTLKVIRAQTNQIYRLLTVRRRSARESSGNG